MNSTKFPTAKERRKMTAKAVEANRIKMAKVAARFVKEEVLTEVLNAESDRVTISEIGRAHV